MPMKRTFKQRTLRTMMTRRMVRLTWENVNSLGLFSTGLTIIALIIMSNKGGSSLCPRITKQKWRDIAN